MLTQLTPEQEALIPVVRNEWMAKIVDPEKRLKLNRAKAKKQVEWLYKFCDQKKPVVWFMDSPLGCQLAAAYLKGVAKEGTSNIWSNIESNIWSKIGSNIRSNIRSNIESNIWSNIGSNIWSNIGSNIRSNIGSNIGSNIRSNIESNIESNIRSNIRSNIESNIRSNIESNIESNIRSNIRSNIESNIRSNIRYESFAWYTGVGIYGWCGYVDFFRRIGQITDEGFDQLVNLLDSGIYDTICLDGIAIVCPMPSVLERTEWADNEMRLHSATGMAIQWPDGYGEYYLHGVHFDEKTWKLATKTKPSMKAILSIENMEQRMAALKLIGPEKLLETTNAELLARSDRGNMLYKVPGIFSETAYYLKYVCPSTARVYVSGVDPEVGSKGDPDLAMSWKFGVTKEQYESLTVEA